MSEYQYYEFVAIERPLTKEEMAEVREFSTRAEITPTRFQNVYNWSDFRGDPEKFMEKYYDFHLYLANWGTHRLLLRFPQRVLDLKTASLYLRGLKYESGAEARAKDGFVILEFVLQEEGGGYWVEDSEGESWTASLVSLHQEIAAGDLRPLYLGWLLGVQSEFGEHHPDDEDDEEEDEDVEGDYQDEDEEDFQDPDDVLEPPVPPGLGSLSAAQQSLADFLEIDEDLIAVAAQRSLPLEEPAASAEEFQHWVLRLPESEKDRLLLRLLDSNPALLRSELLRQFRQSKAPVGRGQPEVEERPRSARTMMVAARGHRKARLKREAEEAARERARLEREAAIARAKHLDSLAGRENELWYQAMSIIEEKRIGEYGQAMENLKDLRDLAARAGRSEEFAARMAQLRERYPTRSGLLKRLAEAGL